MLIANWREWPSSCGARVAFGGKDEKSRPTKKQVKCYSGFGLRTQNLDASNEHSNTPPRRCKGGVQTHGRFQGTRPTVMKLETLSAKPKSTLSLGFDPEAWQLTVIQRILQRYDVIFTAGTSYGKSLIFEGVAAMAGKKRVCIVVTPLKALERDQVRYTLSCTSLVTKSAS